MKKMILGFLILFCVLSLGPPELKFDGIPLTGIYWYEKESGGKEYRFVIHGCSVVQAAEQVNLTTPITKPPINSYKIDSIVLNVTGATITIVLIDTASGEKPVFSYYGTTATDLMKTLNKTDLSIKSLQKRIFERLIADGKIAGTISGVPD